MKSKTSAFTLIELSAVIVIIGILIAGVMTATGLVKKSKIAAAQSLTKSSPIGGIQDNALWLESSAESSFKDTETSTGDAVTTWYDQKNDVNKSSVVAVGTGPTYSNTINYIHAVKFSGSTANYLQVSDASFLNNTDYTIVVLEKRQSASAGYFIGDSSVSTANQTLLLGYSADAAISHSQGTGNVYASTISTYSSSTDTPRVFTFVSDSVNGKKTYINGILAAQSSDTTKLSNITTLAIGKGYTGEIGEIAIFTRALKADERKTTEDYLGKKYSTKINRTTNASGSCINGIVTTNGCTMDCSTASVTGLSSPSTVSDGASGVSGTCGTTGYTGTVTLGCPAGTGVLSASPTICGCDTFGGYSSSGGVCIADCSYTLTGGSPTTGTVSAGTAILNCNTASHYSSSGYTYTCSGGAAITATCACATGYTGSGCSTCDS
ncbi:MAG: LamG-like jellyroll fold domain-containing protein, partial [Pseudomonadota bacterium]